jgi:hypothetical protein
LTLEIVLDCPIDLAYVGRLASEAKLEYHPEFPRPYFRIVRTGWYHVQGIIGACKLRATVMGRSGDNVTAELLALAARDVIDAK